MATDQEAAKNLFRLETLIEQLNEKPGGFDFVLPYQAEEAFAIQASQRFVGRSEP